MSFREVARLAGVSHQTPYHHFHSHMGILQAIAREGFAQLCAAMDTAARAGKDPLESLYAAGVAYVMFARQHVGHFRVMFQGALVDIKEDGTPIEEAEQTHACLVRLSRAAHRAGAGRGLSADAISNLSWSTVHGLAMLLVEGTLRNKHPKAGDDESAIIKQVVGTLRRLLEPASKR